MSLYYKDYYVLNLDKRKDSMLKIRLARAGKKHVPFHRIIVVDSRKKRDGVFIEDLGTFDALKGTMVTFHEERYTQWISKGAQPTDSTKKLYKQYKVRMVPAVENPVAKTIKKTTKKAAVQE
jgi:small subunit ribosomal protein S16